MAEILENLRENLELERVADFTDRATLDLLIVYVVLLIAQFLGQDVSRLLNLNYLLGIVLVFSLPSIAVRIKSRNLELGKLRKGFFSQYSDFKGKIVEFRNLEQVERVIEFSNSLFEQLLLTYLILLLVETVWEGSVSNYLDLTYLMGAVIFTGVISIFSDEEENEGSGDEKNEELERKDYLLIGGMGILGSGIVFYKTQDIGWVSYLVSALSGLLIILLSILVLEEDMEDSELDSSQEVEKNGDS